MLGVPYGERNIIISLLSPRIHVLTELLSPQRLCSQACNAGEQLGLQPRNVFSNFRLWPPGTALHTCTPCLGTLRARSQPDGAWFSQPHIATRTSDISSPRTDDRTEWLVHPAGHDGAETEGPGRLAASILLCKLQCSPSGIKISKQVTYCYLILRQR